MLIQGLQFDPNSTVVASNDSALKRYNDKDTNVKVLGICSKNC